MVRTPLVIWGAGQHAKTVAGVVQAGEAFHISAFLEDTSPSNTGDAIDGLPILRGREHLQALKEKGVHHVLVAIGNNEIRCQLYAVAAKMGFQAATIIHPFSAVSYDCSIGEGTLIRAGSVLEGGTTVGAYAIIGANNSLAHGCHIEAGVRTAAGVTLSGNVLVRSNARIGSGCTILNNVEVGEGALLGAGSVLIRDLPANTVAFGCPAKPVRRVRADDL